MANELYRTYEVLVEESVHPSHPKRAKDRTSKPSLYGDGEIDGALRDTHMIFQDAVCYNTLCFAGLAGYEMHKGGERDGELLNPLWKHLITPAREGGIKEETERVIRRLITHYKPLEKIETAEGANLAEKFLNCVYSEPLRVIDGMSPAERQAVVDLRAKCYRILEKFGTKTKQDGGQECEDMAAFKNNWAGLMSDPESDAEIPGNGAYDCVWRELQKSVAGAKNGKEAAAIIEKVLLRYSEVAEKQNQADCDRDYNSELEKRHKAVSDAESLSDGNAKKSAKVKKAKVALEKWMTTKTEHDQTFFADRRKNLQEAASKALTKPFAAETGPEIDLSEDEFQTVKSRASAIAADPATKTKQLIRLHYKGGATGNFEKAMFRYWLLRGASDSLVRRAALADFRRFIAENKPKEVPSLDTTPITQMPFIERGADFAFLYFGKKCLGIPTPESSPDPEFDKIAFATAAEDVFKYKIRTDVRKARVRKLLNVLQAYENSGAEIAAEHSPTGKKLAVRGMGDDPRWKGDAKRKGIEQLLKEISSDKEIASYGLREGTIGGWAEVRKMFLRRHKQCVNKPKREAVLPNWLERGVDKEQTANRQGFGSADFFHELCDPDYFHLWLSGAAYERHGVKDFIPHFVSYCDWREELVGLVIEDGKELDRGTQKSVAELAKLAKRPIRYTWPGLLNRHKKPSYRYYDFAAKLNPRFPVQLFRRIRPNGNHKSVECYKLIPAKEAVLTLAARRLKRDKIINKNGTTGEWSSVEALWCPPLVLEGERNPKADTKPRAGKEKKKTSDEAEVSFSLIAAPLPEDFWNTVAGVPSTKEAEPVHLTASFKIESDEIAKLRAETKQWLSGSHRGFAKKGEKDADKRRCFTWPIDRETSKYDADSADEKAKVLWCGEGKDSGEWKGFAFRHDKKKSGSKDAIYYEPDFHILSIDLGNRFAAAFTRFRIHTDANGEGRVISADGFAPVIKADMVRAGTLRLQGECAQVWSHVRNANGTCKKDTNENYIYALEDEIYGNGGRGRFPDDKLGEYQKFKQLAVRLVAETSLSLVGTKEQTYPELGDHLIFRLKRRIGRLRTLLNLIWRLCGDKEKDRSGRYTIQRRPEKRPEHLRVVMETLARSAFPRQERQPDEEEDRDDAGLRFVLASDEKWKEWRKQFEKKKGKEEKERKAKLEELAVQYDSAMWNQVTEAVKKQIQGYMAGPDSLDQLLKEVVEFCLPLKGRHWQWRYNPAGERLYWDKPDSSPNWNPNVMGMRGLSMKRLEQILNLRQRCQSFAKLEDRYHGPYKAGNYNPPDSNRDERPDVCPLLLERSNRIREQRVDQTAHLILAEALGMELKNPAEVANKKERKAEVDLHGEYKRRKHKDKDGKEHEYPRCSVIVLENLDRYKMSLGRTKSENSRLMKWAHGKILDKLEDICRPFGITLMLVDPAFSSHFDSRTGLPGVRVNQVSRGFEKEYPCNRWVEGKTKSGGETQLAKDIKRLAQQFAEHPDYKGELVLAVEGGKEFVPVLSPKGGEGLINADVCAAGNIGLRGVADPQRWDVFPRLRTKQLSETEVSVVNWRGWFGKFPEKSEERRMRAIVGASNAPNAEIQNSTALSKRAKGKKGKSADAPAREATSDNADAQSSQSSEYPPFFVGHPDSNYNWLREDDWIAEKAFSFVHGIKQMRAFRQGEYLKRVERECEQRILNINHERLHKR
ncbi:MAG: type V CRISPR-associated protein Cas12b [Verrucomicrobiota bacterium]|nr:type V CRISPR-associated protein Cas12b [Verrucomicrobiota bacterium]